MPGRDAECDVTPPGRWRSPCALPSPSFLSLPPLRRPIRYPYPFAEIFFRRRGRDQKGLVGPTAFRCFQLREWQPRSAEAARPAGYKQSLPQIRCNGRRRRSWWPLRERHAIREALEPAQFRRWQDLGAGQVHASQQVAFQIDRTAGPTQ